MNVVGCSMVGGGGSYRQRKAVTTTWSQIGHGILVSKPEEVLVSKPEEVTALSNIIMNAEKWAAKDRDEVIPLMIKDCRNGEKQLITMTSKNWGQVSGPAMELLEEAKLKYFYQEEEGILEVWMPSAIHQCFGMCLAASLVQNGIRGLLPLEIEKEFKCGTKEYRRFEGEWKGEKKIPDLAFYLRNVHCPTVVVEVVFTQSEKSIEKMVDLWLLGTEMKCKLIIVLVITEEPGWSSASSDVEFSRASSSEQKDGKYGPCYKDRRRFLGTLKCRVESWRCVNGKTVLEQTIRLLPRGDNKLEVFEIKYSDIFGAEENVPKDLRGNSFSSRSLEVKMETFYEMFEEAIQDDVFDRHDLWLKRKLEDERVEIVPGQTKSGERKGRKNPTN